MFTKRRNSITANLYHYIFGLVLLLNLSESYRPLGVLLKISSSSVLSSITLIITLLYIVHKKNQLRYLLKFKIFKCIFYLVVIYPIISLVLSFILDFLNAKELLYWISFNTMYSLLMIGSSIFILNVEYKKIRYLALLSLAICLIGFILNYTNYAFTKAVLEFSNAGAASHEKLFRAISFYPNPNIAALSIVIYLLLFLFMEGHSFKSSFYINILIILISGGMIFLTGSRTSLVLFSFILIFTYFPSIVRTIKYTRKISKSLAYIRVLIMLFLIFLPVLILLPNISEFFRDTMNVGILERMNFFTDLVFGNSKVDDASLKARTEILPKYFQEIYKNPLFGYGPQIVRDKISSGFFANVSQNAFVEGSITFGIPYAFFLLITYLNMFKYSRSVISKKVGNYNLLGTFTIILILLSFSMNNLFWIRAVVIALGLIVGYYIKQLEMSQNYKVL